MWIVLLWSLISLLVGEDPVWIPRYRSRHCFLLAAHPSLRPPPSHSEFWLCWVLSLLETRAQSGTYVTVINCSSSCQCVLSEFELNWQRGGDGSVWASGRDLIQAAERRRCRHCRTSWCWSDQMVQPTEKRRIQYVTAWLSGNQEPYTLWIFTYCKRAG